MDKDKQITNLEEYFLEVRYKMDRDHLRELFDQVSFADFLTLKKIVVHYHLSEPGNRAYLRDIQQEMALPLPTISKMAGHLSDMGYIVWTHDPGTNNGTYIALTSLGLEALNNQQQKLGKHVRDMVEIMGEQRFIEILKGIEELEETHQRVMGLAIC